MDDPPRLPTTSYAVLGLLAISSPMSGYDLAQAVERSVANFWPISRSQVYGELTRLESLGLITGTDIAQTRVPDKRVYELTPAGDAALDTWANDPSYEPDRMRLGFCITLVFAHRMPPELLRESLRRYREEHEEQSQYLQTLVDMLAEMPESKFVRATAQLGLRVARSVVAWADEMLVSLPAEWNIEKEDHDKIHAKARELLEKAPPRPPQRRRR